MVGFCRAHIIAAFHVQVQVKSLGFTIGQRVFMSRDHSVNKRTTIKAGTEGKVLGPAKNAKQLSCSFTGHKQHIAVSSDMLNNYEKGQQRLQEEKVSRQSFVGDVLAAKCLPHIRTHVCVLCVRH